jgi:fibronectin type III domain protein
MNKLILVIGLVVLPLTSYAGQSPRGAEAFAAPSISATIAWDDFNTNLDGFRVYLRKSGATYIGYMNAGTNRVFRFSGLQRKTTYRCYVTAVKGGLESLRSEELSFRTGNKSGDVEEL